MGEPMTIDVDDSYGRTVTARVRDGKAPGSTTVDLVITDPTDADNDGLAELSELEARALALAILTALDVRRAEG